MSPQRHDLVWLSASGWEDVLHDNVLQPVGVRDALARWRGAGWPLVVRRAEPDIAPHMIALGVPLPPEHATGLRTRVATVVPVSAAVRHSPPPELATVLQGAPAHWRTALLALQMEASESQVQLQVYGSLAWQHITGMPYLRAGSDVDLLFKPVTREALATGIALLGRHAQMLPLDGEVVFADGNGVAWKEWLGATVAGHHSPGTRVMAKGASRVGLLDGEVLLRTLDQPA